MVYETQTRIEQLLNSTSIPYFNKIHLALGDKSTANAVLLWGLIKSLNDLGEKELSANDFTRIFPVATGAFVRAKLVLLESGLLKESMTYKNAPRLYEVIYPKNWQDDTKVTTKRYFPKKLNKKVLDKTSKEACILWHFLKDSKEGLSLEDITKALGYKNIASVSRIRNKLVNAGLLKIDSGKGGKGKVAIMEVILP